MLAKWRNDILKPMLWIIALGFATLASAADRVVQEVTLAWRPLQNSSSYEIEISAHPEMEPVLIKKVSSKTNIAFKFKTGVYYYRVRGVKASGKYGPWSEVEGFAVNPSPPEQISPEENWKLLDPAPKEGVLFSWKSGIQGTKYVFEISDDQGTLIKRELPTTEVRWSPSEAGSFQWRVGYETPTGVEWGKYRSFEIKESALFKASVSKGKISGLKWSENQPEISPQGTCDLKLTVQVEGSYDRKGWYLFRGKDRVTVSSSGRFSIQETLTQRSLVMQLTAIGPKGEREVEEHNFYFIDWDRYAARGLDATHGCTGLKSKKWFLSFGAGGTLISHKETGSPDFSGTGLTGKLLFTLMPFSPNWSINLGGNYTLAILSKNIPSSIRFMGLNARLGYALPWLNHPWTLSIFGGFYYTTAFVSGQQLYGFKDMAGPQILLSLRRAFKNGNSLSFHTKYSPVTSSGGGSIFKNNEMAFGAIYSFQLKNGHFMSVTADYAMIQLFVRNSEIQSNSGTLGVSYGF